MITSLVVTTRCHQISLIHISARVTADFGVLLFFFFVWLHSKLMRQMLNLFPSYLNSSRLVNARVESGEGLRMAAGSTAGSGLVLQRTTSRGSHLGSVGIALAQCVFVCGHSVCLGTAPFPLTPPPLPFFNHCLPPSSPLPSSSSAMQIVSFANMKKQARWGKKGRWRRRYTLTCTRTHTHARASTPAPLPHSILSLSSPAHLNKLTLDICCARACTATQSPPERKPVKTGSTHVHAQIVLPALFCRAANTSAATIRHVWMKGNALNWWREKRPRSDAR